MEQPGEKCERKPRGTASASDRKPSSTSCQQIKTKRKTMSITNQNAKELLKNITKLLQDKKTAALASNNPSLGVLVTHLQSITEALKDTYSPNILRFMTKRDAYIKELTASAKNVIDNTMPQTIS